MDEESLLEALKSALSDDVDDMTRGVAGPYASDIGTYPNWKYMYLLLFLVSVQMLF